MKTLYGCEYCDHTAESAELMKDHESQCKKNPDNYTVSHLITKYKNLCEELSYITSDDNEFDQYDYERGQLAAYEDFIQDLNVLAYVEEKRLARNI
jgi:hypothetical protein